MQNLYSMIFKRKSFHKFNDIGKITDEELTDIEKAISGFTRLLPDIKTTIKIVKESETTCGRGGEYCVLFYSEVKDGYLQNVGYIGEQLDLYCAAKNIGALWYGMGKPLNNYGGELKYVIMIAIAKKNADEFRENTSSVTRRELSEVLSGDYYADYINVARFAPSACNSQPWKVETTTKKIVVYRYEDDGNRGIMPVSKMTYFNRIDIGIFICILEQCLINGEERFTKDILPQGDNDDTNAPLTAIYNIE